MDKAVTDAVATLQRHSCRDCQRSHPTPVEAVMGACPGRPQ